MADSNQATEKFIEAWGVMGSVWGINASTARVNALLIVSEEPLSLDDIATRLSISRGNASMCLKELRNWGVIRQVKEPGDRRDYYVSETDAWKMFFAIAKERKRREFDPLVEVVEGTLRLIRKEAGGSSPKVQERLKQMEELVTTLNSIAQRFLASEKMAQSLLPLLMRFSKEGKQ